MVTVYRLQNPYGIGPYTCHAVMDNDIDASSSPRRPNAGDEYPLMVNGKEHNLSDFNSYFLDMNLCNVNYRIFGFISLEQLYNWFSMDEIKKMNKSHRVAIHTFNVDKKKILHGTTQIVFYAKPMRGKYLEGIDYK